MSRGACICSSASRSRRRFPTAAAAPPTPALPIARWRTSAHRRPRPIHSGACSSGRVVHFPYRCDPFVRPTAMPIERRHSAAAERTQPIIAWRAPQVGWLIFPIVAAPLGRPTAMSIERRHPAAAERPRRVSPRATRHARSPILPPHAAHRRLISSYKFLLSPSQFPAAAPIALRSARSAIVLRAPGRFAPHSFPLRPPPFRHPPPWRCPVRRSAAVPPRPSAAQSPESRLCGGLSASIHPLHPPHRPCPKIIVLRSASL